MDSGMFASTEYKREKLKPISRMSVHLENWCIAYMEASSKFRCPSGVKIKFKYLGESKRAIEIQQQVQILWLSKL